MRCTNCDFEDDRSARQCEMCNERFAKKGKGLLITVASIFVIAVAAVVVYFATDLFDGSNGYETLGEDDESALYEDSLYNDLEAMIQGMEITDEALENEFTRYMVEVLMNFRSTYYAERIAGLLQDTDEPTTFFVAVGISHVIREGDHLTNIVEQLDLCGTTADQFLNKGN